MNIYRMRLVINTWSDAARETALAVRQATREALSKTNTTSASGEVFGKLRGSVEGPMVHTEMREHHLYAASRHERESEKATTESGQDAHDAAATAYYKAANAH